MNVHELFYSIQGESSYAGRPCVFIRLSGCNLRCGYCDTREAWENGSNYTIGELLARVDTFGCRLVEITGGEPLLQKAMPDLAERLVRKGHTVLVETNGTQNINVLPARAICIMDIKCPDSGEVEKTDWNNLDRLKQGDEIKFVVCSRRDYEWARGVIRKHELENRFTILFSPAAGKVRSADLAQWILDDRLAAILQLQLHRIIWPDEESGR
ncbi:radical SAM protein [bacterium]|nr:radical SAM protein [bacterium]